MPQGKRAEVLEELRRLLPRMEGMLPGTRVLPFDLPVLDAHLPQGGLPCGALHEVAPASEPDTPAAFGFLAAILGRIRNARPILLVTSPRALAGFGRPYGHGLTYLGLDPSRLILVEAGDDKQALWVMQEALHSNVPAAVAGTLAARLDLKLSQRLHLAAGEAEIPLVLLRPPDTMEASAAATRWRIGTAPAARDRFGIIVRARWRVALERCRNGRPGEWLVEFDHDAHRFSLAAALAGPALPRCAETQSAA
jgi:protein ImuA